ncbi:hypothetical protein [Streptomyces sp. NBC_01803]|uniref:hypothetical protein n=1 Tax=Streptomyces sp. NBC_01803 TaxID=2975946 RepID=UPI002DDB4000|nr:hypothetical protein [Streptomyces sp. NBC_01803]WSA46832.1 hypothetical protein OIE51_23185 [Streptomyces sp. NBC_01803]
MNIDWAVLGQVIVVSVLLTLAVVGLFSVGIRTGSAKSAVRSAGYLCFTACAAAVGYGIWIVAT